MSDGLLLFDTVTERNSTPAKFMEDFYPYLNRTGRRGADYARELLQTWFADFQASPRKRGGLRSSFQSRKNAQHLGAFFEIYIHQLFRSIGWDIQVIEEEKNGRTSDFLATDEDGNRLVIEATTKYISWINPKIAKIIDYLNENLSIPFNLLLSFRAIPHSTEPPLRKIYQFIQVKSDLLKLLFEKFNLPFEQDGLRLTFSENGYEIEFTLSPRTIHEVTDSRVIKGWFEGCYSWNPVPSFVNTIRGKYDQLNKYSMPSVLAINLVISGLSEADITNSLFGRETFSFSFEDNTPPVFSGRLAEGAYGQYQKWQYRDISAVLVFRGLTPFNLRVNPVMYHHPDARFRINNEHFPWEERQVVNGKLITVNPTSLNAWELCNIDGDRLPD